MATRTFLNPIKNPFNHLTNYPSEILSTKTSNNIKLSASTNPMGDFVGLVTHLLDVPDAIGKAIFPSNRAHNHETRDIESKGGNIPVDIIDTPKEFVLYLDVPGLSKSDIQVTAEEEHLLVVRSNGKRKRDENEAEEEGCKYLRLERRPKKNLMRKFRLPENCNMSAISAKCENGVLKIVVEKLPPPPKSKTVQVAIS